MNCAEETVNLREVQHFVYCPHRWGLLYIGCDWSENAFVSRGNLLHERADSGKSSMLRGSRTDRAVQVFQDEWGLFGVLDCLQLTPDKGGCFIEKYGGKFALTVVEYKPSQPAWPRASEADRMQLLAQKICVDSMFGVDCSACFYFADSRQRLSVAFGPEDEQRLREVLAAIRRARSGGGLPPVRRGQYCSGCSVKDICLPKAVTDHA